MPRGNQHKPCPPPEDLERFAREYFSKGDLMPTVLSKLRKHFDNDTYGLSIGTLKKYYKLWNLSGTKKQAHTLESLAPMISEIKAKFPKSGAPDVRAKLRLNYGVKASKALVLQYLNATERAAVCSRIGKRFRRTRFYAAGVNHIWAFDQHDKFKRFGLFFHLGIEPYCGRLLWIIVWWSNRNPRLWAKQYIEAVRSLGGVPLLTQSDLGTENNGIANAHTSIRQYMDNSLTGTLQHRWMTGHGNVKPEIAWRQLRTQWSPGFERLFDEGLEQGWYNPTAIVQKLVFRWLAIPFIQHELDSYRYQHNSTIPRANRHKVLPHGRPDDIFNNPEDFGARDYKVDGIPLEVLNAAEAQWAPPDHPVFQLVPPEFEPFVNSLYEMIGTPTVAFHNFWIVYNSMMAAGTVHFGEFPDAQALVEAHGDVLGIDEQLDEVPLLPHARSGNFGQHDVPRAVIILDDMDGTQEGARGVENNDQNDGFLDEQMEEAFEVDHNRAGRADFDGTITYEDLPEVEITDSEDEGVDELY